MVDDARYRMKLWIETYDNTLNVTKDDGVSLAKYIVCYGMPDYPLDLVFFGSKNVDGIYACDNPTSTPLLDSDADHTTYGYREQVPMHILTVDKVGVTGTKLTFTLEAELRRILEDHPLGSLRGLNQTRSHDRDMGGWKLYDKEYVVDYERDTT